jgi:lycopene beta-cyclase
LNNRHFDYIIIGAGAAGLQLALRMAKDSFFADKKILLLDRSPKQSNDRTWSFWEKGDGEWDSLCWNSWSFAKFKNTDADLHLDLSPYKYKSLRGLDFYNHARSVLYGNPTFIWFQEEVVEVKEMADEVELKTPWHTYTCTYLFDSRIDEAFFEDEDSYNRLLQHFKGWVIETPLPCFNEDAFTMMDFRWKEAGTTSFMYVLPVSPTKALVEFTYFSPALVEERFYEEKIRAYLKDELKLDSYSIVETEFGIIPMSDFPFERGSSPRVIKIGTAGGWVKPSTGYSFKNGGRLSLKIVENLKSGLPPANLLFSRKHRWYDRLLVDVLMKQNDIGPQIFSQMYKKNKVQQIFRFLDDETTLWEDIRIIASFSPWPFLKALVRTSIRKH